MPPDPMVDYNINGLGETHLLAFLHCVTHYHIASRLGRASFFGHWNIRSVTQAKDHN
jgi:hypothetical protein